MRIFKQLGIVFAVCLAGKIVCRFLPFEFPESVMGMIIMLLLLLYKVISLRDIKHVSEFLLANMAFFFIPAGVGIMAHLSVVEGKIPALFAVCVLTTLITFVVTAYTIMFVVKIQRR